MGVLLAQELLKEVHSNIAGVYFVPSFGRYEVAAQVLNGLPEIIKAVAIGRSLNHPPGLLQVLLDGLQKLTRGNAVNGAVIEG